MAFYLLSVLTALAAASAAAAAASSQSPVDLVNYGAFGRRLRDAGQPESAPELKEALGRLLGHSEELREAARRLRDALLLSGLDAGGSGASEGVFTIQKGNGSLELSPCANQTVAVINGLLRKEKWAVDFLDSDAKPPSAVGYGAHLWLGNYDQCMSSGRAEPTGPASSTGGRALRGSYCLTYAIDLGAPTRAAGGLATSALSLGVCWPDTCTPEQATNLTQLLLTPVQMLLPANHSLYVVPSLTQCHMPRSELPWTPGAVAMTCLLVIFFTLILLGTAYDLISKLRISFHKSRSSDKELLVNDPQPTDTVQITANGGPASGHASAGGTHDAKKPHMILRLLLCFSAYTNARKIVDVSHPDGTLTCVHGLRFLSMSWVILGHTYYFAFSTINNMGQLYHTWQNDWTFQVIANATVSVDSFFVLSGLLSTYLFFRELQRLGGSLRKINWFMFYAHRYWRLTPPYLLVMATYVCLFQYVYEGPAYPQSPSGIDPECPTSWWRNALYINNLFNDAGGGCMGWSWYLANDMQFYVISPILFALLAVKPAIGLGATAALLLASMTAMGVHSTLEGLNVGFLGIEQEFSGIYIKPWYRITPYLVGVIAGYALHRLSGRTWRPHRLIILTGWIAAAGVALSIIYGLYDVDGGRVTLAQGVSSFYNAVYRPAWAAAVAWVTVACVTGNGGWVNSFLSQPLFAPLSRLTYCAYLVHPVVMMAYYLSRRQALVWDNFSVIQAFFGNSMLAYMAAFIASLLFEAPLIGLERVLRGR